MANPTAMVQSVSRKYDDTKRKVVFPPTPDTYYPNELIGRRLSDGLAAHFDDSAAMVFLGFFEGPRFYISTDLPTAGLEREVNRPARFTMPLISGTASRVTDIGKAVYAVDSGHVTLNPLATTFANLVGYLDDVLVSTPGQLTGGNVWIAPAIAAGRQALGGLLIAPATGGKTYGIEILNKLVEVPNTAQETLILPPVGSTGPGDRIAFVKTTAAAFPFLLQGNAAETINGGNIYTSGAAQWASVEIYSDGTQWILDTPPAGGVLSGSRLNVGPAAVDVYGAAVTIDVTKSLHIIAASFTTAAASTFTPSGPGAAGDLLTIMTETDASGTCTVTFGGTFHSSGTQATLLSKFSTAIFQSDGVRWLEMSRVTALA